MRRSWPVESHLEEAEAHTSARGENGKRAYGVRDAVFSQRTADRPPIVVPCGGGGKMVKKRPPGKEA